MKRSLILCLSLAILLCPNFLLGQDVPLTLQTPCALNNWTQKADYPGVWRSGAISFSIGSKGYILTNEFWEYDTATDAWTKKADFGGGIRMDAVGFSIGMKGYVVSGFDPIAGELKKDLWEYDPMVNTWTQRADFGGTARVFATGFSIGSKGYMGTGIDNFSNLKNDFWEYDPAVNSWTRKADLPGGTRWEATGMGIGSKGYMGTGWLRSSNTSEPIKMVDDFWEYNPIINTWVAAPAYPGGTTFGATCFSIGNKGYLGSGNVKKEFWMFNPSAYSWHRIADLGGIARQGAVAFNIGNKGYVGIGHGSFYDENNLYDLWEYVPDDSAPVLNCPANVSYYKNNINYYNIAALIATDNCGIAETRYEISGATIRSGTGANASGIFNEGVSVIRWTVKDNSNNINTCSVTVTIIECKPKLNVTGKIEAENYDAMQGVQTEPTTDAGGGLNLGYIDYGDWMDYKINVPFAGQYDLILRLATPSTSNPQVQIKNGDNELATVHVPNTGGFQTWQDVSIHVNLQAGNQTIRLLSTGGGYWNINWLRFKLPMDYYTLIPARIEAEDWTHMQGVENEFTLDECTGGINLGYIDYGDWMDYNIQVPASGTYELKFRLATPSTSNPQFQVKNGATVLATVNVPNTGGFQIWQDVTILVTLPSGNQTIRLMSTGGGYWNINWLEFILPINDYLLIPAKIEAEDWSEMQGVQPENTSDAGNGKNVGYIDYGDWMDYKIQVPSSGNYELKFRLATPSTSYPQFQVKNGATVLATVNVPNTGGFQIWQTNSVMVNLPAGNQTIRLLSTGGGYWNINWMEFAMPATFTMKGSSKDILELNPVMRLFPNPVNETTTLELNNESEGQVNVDIIGMNGNVLKQYKFNKGMRHSKYTISLSGLPAGTYMLRMQQNGNVETVKLLKL